MNAIILSVGDELTLGQTVDTNSAWLSRQLAAVGCAVSAHITVADDQPAIEQSIRQAVPRCDFLIVSGGIGPTEDDLTRQALAAVMERPLEANEQWIEALRGFFEKRGRAMPERNRIQAMIPRGATMIYNHAGTAAGIQARLADAEVFILPGVPKEMMLMFQRDVLPHVERRGAGACILSRTLHTFGLGESWVAEKLGELMTRGRNPSVGTTVSGGIVSIRINACFDSRHQSAQELDRTIAACRQKLGDIIFGEEDQTLQEVVGAMLREQNRIITTAESCTGGLLAKMLTDVAGSSAYYRQGWITYADEAKRTLLGVDVAGHGAVSEPTVRAMAQNARERSEADAALAISGIAGPTGGTPEKPVGTVHIALAHVGGTLSRHFNFPGDRDMIRDRAAKMAMAMLRYHLLGRPMPF